MKVLIIDDSSVDRHHLTSLLESLGYEVDAYSSTQGVINQVSQQAYDYLFLDIVMPEQDGYKFLRELRANPATANQRVVLYSSKGTPLEVSYGLKRSGANHYMVKPATKEKLATLLQPA
ncbi:response regulator [Lyngbya confervoides]|uniref:Response regulator n=1 Tax=Lyngbya confervoides BDU141951 TaxID=1574623 RepID=A0ABD4T8K4_9CYAN|nr:response regulator [Lyngbya confervoides]MCM1984926.1 response regulator [Lyngbya confervoides BDU141951]